MSLSKLTTKYIASKLPKRPKDANKGTFGKVLVIAGSAKYPGAAYLSCAACYRVGAGLVTLATIPVVQNIVSKKLAEVTFIVLPEKEGAIGEPALDKLFDQIGKFDVILFGPGLDKGEQTTKFIHKFLKCGIGDLNLVIDGDGLNILSKLADWDQLLKNSSSRAILTPHPGEMARLIGESIKEIQLDRENIAQKYASIWGQVIVLKGANTVIASPGGEVAVSPFALPSLATAGTGDVLSGVITGLMAQGLDGFDASCTGVYLHGLATEEFNKKVGERGMIASDLLQFLPKVIAALS